MHLYDKAKTISKIMAPSANRIRERYLHQLGLQRGSKPQGPLAPPTQHVVVIGLPSLPEERETNVPRSLQLESHDFSQYQHNGDGSQHTADSEMGESRSQGGDSDSGSSHRRSQGPSPTIQTTGAELNVPITSLALSYPTAVLKPPPGINKTAPPASSSNPIARLFSKGAPKQYQSAISKHVTDQDSVTSTGTSTTAGSSLSAMVSRDWATTPSGQCVEPMAVESDCSSSTALHGVYRGNFGAKPSAASHCPTSSLTHALKRFNIDSDCDGSIASGSFAGGGHSIATEGDDHAMDEDDASVHSHTSFVSIGSQRSHLSSTPRPRGRKAGKAQLLLDRAVAHDRILQIRNEQSQKTRANLIYTQRMVHHQEAAETRSRSSSTSSQSSIPLLHVQHGNTSQAPTTHFNPPPEPLHYGGDLARTPTLSNCSHLRRMNGSQAPVGLAYQNCNSSTPTGVHVTSQMPLQIHSQRPLVFHPELASAAPLYHSPEISSVKSSQGIITSNFSSSSNPAHESIAHRRQASVDDVLEAVEALSKLKGKSTGSMIPRIR